MKKFLSFILFISFALNLSAQYKQGLKYYDQFDYNMAIVKFKKALKPGSENYTEVLVKLADSYRFIRDFKNAATYYKRAIESGTVEPKVHYYCGEALKNNNQFEEAAKEFNVFLKDHPDDSKTKNSIKACADMNKLLSLPKEYTLSNLSSINTKHSEFCPVLIGTKLVFISNNKSDQVNFDKFNEDGSPFLSTYYSDITNDTSFSPANQFAKSLNSTLHLGPVCFSDSTAIYFTTIDTKEKKNDRSFVNKPKIYFSEKDGKGWKKPASFQYNSEDYCFAHPSVSKDGTAIYFASNMPGGQGGMDIWMCKKDNTGWSAPVNLGNDINTSGNEEFPCIRKDDILFFSSDGLPGFGGLDIFSARQKDGKWGLRKNEGQSLNSSADDFGICFIDNTKGYVSSNRDGGNGADDIYKFSFNPVNNAIEGTVLRSREISNIAPDYNILLKDENNNLISSTRTNEKGYFRFDNINTGKKYIVKVDDTDANFKAVKHFYYADRNDKVIRESGENEKGEKYVFKNLPAEAGSPPDFGSADISMAGNLIYGQNPTNPVPGAQITLLDENGQEISRSITNFFGSFSFDRIDPNRDYKLKVSAPNGLKIPANARIVLTNKNGKEIQVIRSDVSGKYEFNKLATDKTAIHDMRVDGSDLIMDLNGKILDADKKQLPDTRVSLLNEKGETILVDTSDVNGKFKFKKLKTGKDYTISVEPTDKNLQKIYLTDLEERLVRELVRDLKGFNYTILASEPSTLKEIYVDDPWLAVLDFKEKEIIIQESVYYGSGEFQLGSAGLNILDKVILVLKSNTNITIEIGSHTDSKGNDDFNLNLSKKRANFAANYIISKGITASRVKGIGYGETKIINKCANDVPCADAEHAKNRRTEFRVINTKK